MPGWVIQIGQAHQNIEAQEEIAMPRRLRTNPPTHAALLVSVVLWLLGVADLLLGAVSLPYNLGLWALILAGFIMILASIVYGL